MINGPCVHGHVVCGAHRKRSSSASPVARPPNGSRNGDAASAACGLWVCAGDCSTTRWKLLPARLSAKEPCTCVSVGVRTENRAAEGSRGTNDPLGLLPRSDPNESATGDVPKGAADEMVRGAAAGLQWRRVARYCMRFAHCCMERPQVIV